MGVDKLPYPPVKPRTPVEVRITEGLTPTGASAVKDSYKGPCFYNERSAWVQDAEGKKVESKGLVIFFHDICTSVEQLTGYAQIGGKEFQIIIGKRLRNPDGTVHHVELELM